MSRDQGPDRIFPRYAPGSLAHKRRAAASAEKGPKRALGRSLRDFGTLQPAEQVLLQACRAGLGAKLGDQLPSESAVKALRVRAAFLRFMLLGGDEDAPVHEHGVQLGGAFIEGNLDLIQCRLPYGIALVNCRFEEVIQLRDAYVCGSAVFSGSLAVQGIEASRATVEGSLFLNDSFKATGEVELLGARIGGQLSCSNGQFEVENGDALSADGAVVHGDVFLNASFKATGQVRLPGVQIGGHLNCTDGQFQVKAGTALSADRAVVKGSVLLNDSFKATGEVRLLGAQIGGHLFCAHGRLEVRADVALSADGSVVKGGVFLNKKFRATGEVRLLGVRIGGDLTCRKGSFEVEGGFALSADGAQVGGSLFFDENFRATGQVRLPGVQIGGDLECRNSQFEVVGGAALMAAGALVKGGWVLYSPEAPFVIDASHMEVGVLADDPATWGKGSILDGFRYGTFGGSAPTQARARLDWLARQSEEHLGQTEDGRRGFRPQPWRQLERVLREMGHVDDARQVGIAFQKQLYKIDRIGSSPEGTHCICACGKKMVARAFHYAFGLLSQYGYSPMRLGAWMFAVWLVCGLAYWWLALPPDNAIGPSNPLVFQHPDYRACMEANGGNAYLCKAVPGEYSTFSPLAYSLDVLLPLVDLGQERSWGPIVKSPEAHWFDELTSLSWGHIARWLMWFETLFGWISSLMLVAIVSGLARRGEE